MEALFVYISKKLEAIRYGDQPACAPSQYILELKTWAFWRAVFAEFLATLIFVFLGCASTYSFGVDLGDETAATESRLIRIALTFGLAIMVLIQMIGHVSGGHINPAVSIAMAVSMSISPIRSLLYVCAQSGGAIVGGLLLKAVTVPSWNTTIALGVTGVNPSIDVGQGLAVEIILTFVLLMVIYGTTDSNRTDFGSASLAIGLTVTTGHLAGIQYTGSSMNPARSLGSAVVSDIYTDHWVYWVGPILGGILAAVIYKLIINPYRGVVNMEKAMDRLMEDSRFVVIPRDYFKDQPSGNSKTLIVSEQL